MKKMTLLLCLLMMISNLLAQVSLLEIGDKFELTEIKMMDGGAYSLEDLKDKVIVLNFWSIGCTPCEMERPYLNELYQQYKDKEDVVFWSITLNKVENISDFLAKHPIDWEIKGDVDFMGKFSDDKSFVINCMPTSIIIDKNRIINYNQCVNISAGASGDAFAKIIDQARTN